MDGALERYRKEGNIEMILHRQTEILSNLPKDGLLLRDIGGLGLIYQCANCRVFIMEDEEENPRTDKCDCGNRFYENDKFKILDVRKLLGTEYEIEDLESFKANNKKEKDDKQLRIDKYFN